MSLNVQQHTSYCSIQTDYLKKIIGKILLKYIYTTTHKTAHFFQNFLKGSMSQNNMCAAIILLFLCKMAIVYVEF